jgi:hypothetical protein
VNRYRRHKLRAHDHGIDRHNKGVAYGRKKARLAEEHTGRRRTADAPPEAGSPDPHGPGCVCQECAA